jgi:hypothetical protein
MYVGKLKGAEKMLQMAGKCKLWKRESGVLLHFVTLHTLTQLHMACNYCLTQRNVVLNDVCLASELLR